MVPSISAERLVLGHRLFLWWTEAGVDQRLCTLWCLHGYPWMYGTVPRLVAEARVFNVA